MRNSCRRGVGAVINRPRAISDRPYELKTEGKCVIIYPRKRGRCVCIRCCLSAMAKSCRISKSACASKEIPIPKLHLPTVYQRKPRAKLAEINKHLSTADSAIGQVFLIYINPMHQITTSAVNVTKVSMVTP